MNTQKETSLKGEIRAPKKQSLKSRIIRDKQLYFMLAPFLLYYLLFYYAPLYGIQIAFKDYEPFLGMVDSPWAGMKHFVNFFTGPYAWRTIRNTLMINIYDLMFQFTGTIVIAILLNEIVHKKLRTCIQTVLYMPHFISIVVVAGMVISILSPTAGIINQVIAKLGGDKINFLAKPDYFRTIFVSMQAWAGVGFGTIIYTSAMCAIDESLYEAADIDGAGRLRKIWHITLPGIKSTVVVMFILRMGSMLSVGSDAIILLYQPITYETADVISTFVYRYGLENGDYSFATAVGLFNSVVALVLVATANKISRKVNEMSLW